MSNKIVTIIDYGVGNLFSVTNAIHKCGFQANATSDVNEILNAKALILPGVGAFKNGIDNIKKKNLVDAIKKFVAQGKPLLGICLGMQLLAKKSLEFGVHNGLSIIDGTVMPLANHIKLGKNIKIPNIGWTELEKTCNLDWQKTIFNNLRTSDQVYLIHSYYFKPSDSKYILANADFNGKKICIAVKKGNVYGTQFHPEKSGEVGLQVLRNFCNLQN